MRFGHFPSIVSPPLAGALVLLTLSALLRARPAGSTERISYRLGWELPNSHLFDIAVEVDLAGGVSTTGGSETRGEAPLDFAIPAWRPGRYVLQNYAGNICCFRAEDGQGNPLRWEKVDVNTWRVYPGGAARVVARYRYYANVLDGGSSLLTDEEAYVNGINLFMYVAGRLEEPALLTLDLPEGWQIATGLRVAVGGSAEAAPAGVAPAPITPEGSRLGPATERVCRAASYHELVDCPFIAGPSLRILEVTADSIPVRAAFQGEGEVDEAKITESLRKLMAEQLAFWGEAPFRDYTFLYHIVPSGGHGVEHLNSTSITVVREALEREDQFRRFLSVSSHELFHSWNVKWIRPAALVPYDYSRAQYTRLLWLSEGITDYYGWLLLKRARLIDRARYLKGLADQIEGLQNSSGRKVSSVAEASFDAWCKGYGQGAPYLSVSFYNKGHLLGLLLDLEIRRRTENKRCLDDVMRLLLEGYARGGQGMPEDGLHAAVEEVAGSDFGEFWRRSVEGTEEIDFGQFLDAAGLRLVEKTTRKRPSARLGVALKQGARRAEIEHVLPDGPALRGELMDGDVILSIGGDRVTARGIHRALKRHRSGEKVKVIVERRGKEREFEVTLEGGGNIERSIEQVEEPTSLQRAINEGWLKDAWLEGRSP